MNKYKLFAHQCHAASKILTRIHQSNTCAVWRRLGICFFTNYLHPVSTIWWVMVQENRGEMQQCWWKMGWYLACGFNTIFNEHWIWFTSGLSYLSVRRQIPGRGSVGSDGQQKKTMVKTAHRFQVQTKPILADYSTSQNCVGVYRQFLIDIFPTLPTSFLVPLYTM